MNVELLSKMIYELIVDHDEVALPGLGTFVAEMVPASFSDRGYTINPPYRKLSFRPVEGRDTLLPDFYARSNKVAVDDARKIISAFIVTLKSELLKKKTIHLPSLGRLRATKENYIFFIANADLNIYVQGYGLEPVSLKTHVETPEEVSSELEHLRSIVRSEDLLYPVVGDSGMQMLPDAPAEPQEQQEMEAVAPQQPDVPQMEETPEKHVQVEKQENVAAVQHVREKKKRKKLPRYAVVLLAVGGVAAVLVAVLFILAHTAPELIDPLLYTKEQLAILRYQF